MRYLVYVSLLHLYPMLPSKSSGECTSFLPIFSSQQACQVGKAGRGGLSSSRPLRLIPVVILTQSFLNALEHTASENVIPEIRKKASAKCYRPEIPPL